MFYGFPSLGFFEDSNLSPFIEKLDKGKLTLEDILKEDSIMQDIRTNNNSKFINFLTSEKIKKLIDYSTKFPSQEDHNTGHKFPFNATEILCLDNTNFQNIFMTEKIYKSNEDMDDKEAIKKIKKGRGFLLVLFNAINENNEIVKKDENEEQKGEKNDDGEESEEDEEEEQKSEENEKNEKKDEKNEKKEENQKIIYENVDYLLNFLKESDRTKDNYVLVGYFYKILNSLINIHQMKIVKYLLDYPNKDEFDILNLFIKHMNRKSMCNIIQKLLIFDDELMSKYDEKKIDLLAKIFNELELTEDKNKYECMSECVCAIMGNRQFFDLFMTKKDLLEKIYNTIFNCNNNDKYIYIIKILIRINENILQHFPVHFTENPNDNNNNDLNQLNIDTCVSIDKSLSSPEDNIDILKKYLLTLFDCIEKNKFEFFNDFGNKHNEAINDEFNSTYMEKQKKLGMKNIVQTVYLKTLIDIFVNSYASKYHENKIEQLIKIGTEKNIFWNLHDLFLDYPFSNIFQIYYHQIMKIVANENSPKCLIDAFLTEGNNQKRNLIEIFINKMISDMKFNFKLTNTVSFNPLFSYIISILNKIFTSNNSYIKSIIEKNNDLSAFNEIIGQEIENIFTSKLLLSDNNLGGYGFDTGDDTPLQTFGPKNFLEIFDEDCKIYEMYKNGEDYKKALNEKKERMEKEKEESLKNKNKNVRKSLEYDDFEEEDDPLFKVEKINLKSLQNEKNDFLSLLNKPPEYIKSTQEEVNINDIKVLKDAKDAKDAKDDKDVKEEENQLSKEENLRILRNEKDDFLALLNKPTEEVNAEEENKDVIIDNIENDGDLKTEQIGRFKELWDEEEDKEENNDDKNEEKDKENNENKNIDEENKDNNNENKQNDKEEKENLEEI